jgi:hypothetical protein
VTRKLSVSFIRFHCAASGLMPMWTRLGETLSERGIMDIFAPTCPRPGGVAAQWMHHNIHDHFLNRRRPRTLLAMAESEHPGVCLQFVNLIVIKSLRSRKHWLSQPRFIDYVVALQCSAGDRVGAPSHLAMTRRILEQSWLWWGDDG